jgi:NADH-quinone oxidoreductase subunit G
MITIFIDGKEYKTEAGDNLLNTCIKLGIDIPHFCFHPALGSVGSCRLCAVKRYRDSQDKVGRIVMSCMEAVSDGMIISTEDEEVKIFRASVIESLMTNHPHDCPICDEGGECHLQDMVVASGHVYRRYEFKKRTFNNQYLGPFIQHEMNRCIQCYRCVRFYADYAGGKDFGVYGSHNKVYFGRFKDGPLESIFSGNLVEVCPTGVFTDKTLHNHYTRKWDLTNAPSVCDHCSAGCNIIMGERYGTVRRVLNRYNDDVNGFFICDKGRFGYEYINGQNSRVLQPIINSQPVSHDQAKEWLKETVSKGKTIGIGSSRASVEANYMLRRLVGKENFYAGISSQQYNLIKTAVNVYQSKQTEILSLKEIEKAEGILVIGEDVYNTSPRLALSIRQSVKNIPLQKAQKKAISSWNASAVKTFIGNDHGPLFVATPQATWLDEIASLSLRYNTEQSEQLLNSMVTLLENKNTSSSDKLQQAIEIVTALKNCKSVAIICGTTEGSEKIINLCARVSSILNNNNIKSGIYCVVPDANSIGSAILADKSYEEIFSNPLDATNIIALEPDDTMMDRYSGRLSEIENFIVMQHTKNNITKISNACIPISTIAESDGTLINAEGRMQRYFSVMLSKENIAPSWQWLSEISENLSFQQIQEAISSEIPLLKKIKEVAPNPQYRINGKKIPRQTPRFSGRTSMLANITLHEPKPAEDVNSPLAFSMEGTSLNEDATLTSFYLKPGWHSVQASYKIFNELDNAARAKSSGIRIW